VGFPPKTGGWVYGCHLSATFPLAEKHQPHIIVNYLFILRGQWVVGFLGGWEAVWVVPSLRLIHRNAVFA